MHTIGMAKTRCKRLPPFPMSVKQVEVPSDKRNMKHFVGKKDDKIQQE
jgi:hypothetical protein